jgi:hypothetical protein
MAVVRETPDRLTPNACPERHAAGQSCLKNSSGTPVAELIASQYRNLYIEQVIIWLLVDQDPGADFYPVTAPDSTNKGLKLGGKIQLIICLEVKLDVRNRPIGSTYDPISIAGSYSPAEKRPSIVVHES